MDLHFHQMEHDILSTMLQCHTLEKSAIIVLLFDIFPMLLLLMYPTKPFQKLLNCFPQMHWDYLHIFMDFFQGYTKKELWTSYHYFTGLYLLIRFIHHISIIHSAGSHMILIQSILHLTISLLFYDHTEMISVTD